MPKSRVKLLIIVATAILIAVPLQASRQAIVHIEPAMPDFSVYKASLVEYRGRLYPLVNIRLGLDPVPMECSSYDVVYVGKNMMNITSLALSSGTVYLDEDTCTLIVDGSRLRGIAYIDDSPLTIIISRGATRINITITLSDVKEKPQSMDHPQVVPHEQVWNRSRIPTEDTTVEERGAYTGVNPEILAGITLVLLLAASVVYEYALGRGDRGAKKRESSDDLR